jgi:hypothetical protein
MTGACTDPVPAHSGPMPRHRGWVSQTLPHNRQLGVSIIDGPIVSNCRWRMRGSVSVACRSRTAHRASRSSLSLMRVFALKLVPTMRCSRWHPRRWRTLLAVAEAQWALQKQRGGGAVAYENLALKLAGKIDPFPSIAVLVATRSYLPTLAGSLRPRRRPNEISTWACA